MTSPRQENRDRAGQKWGARIEDEERGWCSVCGRRRKGGWACGSQRGAAEVGGRSGVWGSERWHRMTMMGTECPEAMAPGPGRGPRRPGGLRPSGTLRRVADGRCSLCREAVSCRTSPSGVMAWSLPHPQGLSSSQCTFPFRHSHPQAGTRAAHGRAGWVTPRWVAPSRILVRSLLSKDFCLRFLLRMHSSSIFFWGKKWWLWMT